MLTCNHHDIFEYDLLQSVPDFEMPDSVSFTVKAVTKYGKTTLENHKFNTYNKHIGAYKDIIKSIDPNYDFDDKSLEI